MERGEERKLQPVKSSTNSYSLTAVLRAFQSLPPQQNKRCILLTHSTHSLSFSQIRSTQFTHTQQTLSLSHIRSILLTHSRLSLFLSHSLAKMSSPFSPAKFEVGGKKAPPVPEETKGTVHANSISFHLPLFICIS